MHISQNKSKVTCEAAIANIPSPSLLVWDADAEPCQWDGHIALWKGFAEAGAQNTTTLHGIVEEKAEEFRARYLAWVYDFGEALVDGKRVIDHLEMRGGFSYWWMTLPSLASFGSETSVYNAVRMLALEHLARDLGCKSITLVTDDKALSAAIRRYCGNAGLVFQWRRIGAKAKSVSIARKIFRALPYPLQGLISLLLHIRRRWLLRNNAEHFCMGFPDGITFVDYLIHLNSDDIIQGRFGSNYWTDLVSVLQEYGAKTSWIHHYVSHSLIPSARQAKNLIDKFNKKEAGFQSHITLDSSTCLPVLWGVVRDYMRILAMGVKLRPIRLQFIPKGSDVDFEPLIREDWLKFLFGNKAVSSCIFLNEFEFLLKGMPRQRIGIYIQENQPWEMAFIHAWKSAGHGRLVGVPHTTVLFWDTRYYREPRSYQHRGRNDMPMPDQVALNGPASISSYSGGDYPKDQMVEVEALRYLYLNNLSLRRTEGNVNKEKTLHVLVLGDYSPAVTHKQMELLMAAAVLLPSNIRYIVKPHPGCAIKPAGYPSLQFDIADSPLAELLSECDVAYTSNITSAAVDAYCVGIPVASVLDGDAFNMSPLRGMSGVVFVTNPIELADVLRNSRSLAMVAAKPYFCLDKGLTRWRALLGLNQTNSEHSVCT